MRNGLGEIQTMVLLGGTSEIGRAIVSRLATPATTTIVLAGRDETALAPAAFDAPGRQVLTRRFEGTATTRHQAFADELAAEVGDLDVVIVAFGQLGDQTALGSDAAATAELIEVNFTGAAAALVAFASVLRRQGHGHLVVLSSVAGERVRKSNFVYGATKAGLDGFAQGLGDELAGTGVEVLVVRPGFVHSKMTAGLKPAPLATTPDAVAEVVAKGLESGRRTVWAPGALRPLFSVLRHLPGALWRRLPL